MNDDELVTVATFETVVPAEVASGVLEAAGILNTLADDHLISLNWAYSHVVGGVKLQVRRADLHDAYQVLVEGYTQNVPAQATSTCPSCESGRVAFVQGIKPEQIPLYFGHDGRLLGAESHFHCADCDARWLIEQDDEDEE